MTDRSLSVNLKENIYKNSFFSEIALRFVQFEFFTTGELNAKMRIKSEVGERVSVRPDDRRRHSILIHNYKEE